MELNIGTNLKRLRTAKGITQEQLSDVMNVSCAAVSKWERGETYPDITLLQPLAYYFGVSLDELMGYDGNKIKTRIDEIIRNYRNCRDAAEASKIIADGYREFPNDYGIMYYYMYEIIGGCADNDSDNLLNAKEILQTICNKILSGCIDIDYRLGAWDILAKILHAEGKTDEAIRIYNENFPNWYYSGEQKSEQLFPKDTDEYYFRVRKNMYELADFSADKLGRTVFFDPCLSMDEKTERALKYGELLMNAYAKHPALPVRQSRMCGFVTVERELFVFSIVCVFPINKRLIQQTGQLYSCKIIIRKSI